MICPTCKEDKPKEAFYNVKYLPCKPCQNARVAESDKRNPGRIRASQKAWYARLKLNLTKYAEYKAKRKTYESYRNYKKKLTACGLSETE